MALSISSIRGRILLSHFNRYLQRTYPEITSTQLSQLSAKGISCTIRTSVEFISDGIVQTVGSYLQSQSFTAAKDRKRQNCFVACQLVPTNCVEIYFASVKKILEVEVGLDFSSQWSNWQQKFFLLYVDWANDIRLGDRKQLYKPGSSKQVFSAPSLEDVTVVKRLISIVEHSVPVIYQPTSSY